MGWKGRGLGGLFLRDGMEQERGNEGREKREEGEGREKNGWGKPVLPMKKSFPRPCNCLNLLTALEPLVDDLILSCVLQRHKLSNAAG